MRHWVEREEKIILLSNAASLVETSWPCFSVLRELKQPVELEVESAVKTALAREVLSRIDKVLSCTMKIVERGIIKCFTFHCVEPV